MIEFKISTNPKKKYDAYVYINGKLDRKVSFGARGYEQYYDKIGRYSEFNHNDKKRRDAYRYRHSKILTKSGVPGYQVKYSPAWFSWNYLW